MGRESYFEARFPCGLVISGFVADEATLKTLESLAASGGLAKGLADLVSREAAASWTITPTEEALRFHRKTSP